MAETITIRYYDRTGNILEEETTSDEYTPENIHRWEAWLNDPNLEQTCTFDQYEIIKTTQRRSHTPRREPMELTGPYGEEYLLEVDAGPCSHTDLADEAQREPGGERYTATPLTEDGYRTGPEIELLWYEEHGRAGLACGGDAAWTDAQSPQDALERYLGIDGKEMLE